MTHLFAFTLFYLALFSHAAAPWDKLEAQLDLHPDSVQRRLVCYDVRTLKAADAARYATLRTLADYKTYTPITSDTLIARAVQYYGTRRATRPVAMAWYALGCARSDMGDDARAVDAWLTAATLFPDTTSRYRSLCWLNVADCYTRRAMYAEAEEAYATFLRSPSLTTKDSLVAIYRMGCAKVRREEYVEAHRLLASLTQASAAPTGMKRKALFEMAKAECYGLGWPDSARVHALASLGDAPFGAKWLVLGDAYGALSHPDSARHCYLQALRCKEELYTSCALYDRLIAIDLQRHAYDSIAVWMDRHDLLLDSIHHTENQADIAAVIHQHQLAAQEQEHQHKQRQRALILTITLTAFLSLAAIVVLTYANRRKEAYIRLQKLLTQARATYRERTLLSASTTPAATAAAEDAGASLSVWWAQCEASAEEFRHTEWWPRVTAAEAVGKTFTTAERVELHEVMLGCFYDCMMSLKDEFDTLSADDILYCIYGCLQCTNRTVTYCEAAMIETLRKRKSRIKAKISSDHFQLLFPSLV